MPHQLRVKPPVIPIRKGELVAVCVTHSNPQGVTGPHYQRWYIGEATRSDKTGRVKEVKLLPSGSVRKIVPAGDTFVRSITPKNQPWVRKLADGPKLADGYETATDLVKAVRIFVKGQHE